MVYSLSVLEISQLLDIRLLHLTLAMSLRIMETIYIAAEVIQSNFKPNFNKNPMKINVVQDEWKHEKYF